MFEGSTSEPLNDVSVTRIGDALSYGVPQTDLAFMEPLVMICMLMDTSPSSKQKDKRTFVI